MGEAIDEFNQLKTKPGVYTRETLDNFVKALLYKNFEANGGVVAEDMTKWGKLIAEAGIKVD